jgi:Tol biopolymer transport system component
MMKQFIKQQWYFVFLLALLSVSLQSCLGVGQNNPFGDRSTNNNGGTIKVNMSDQTRWKGKIYFTLSRNLYVLDGKTLNLTQLTNNMDVRDPAVSPDGQWIAFINRAKNYSDLDYISTNSADKTVHTVVTGNGHYIAGTQGSNTFYWFAQPAWSADSTQLLFLSDLQKDFVWSSLGPPYSQVAFLDMQVFSLPVKVSLTATQATRQAQVIGYATYGDGGNQGPSYRPGHPEQVMYTTFRYDTTGTHQIVQINIEDTTFLINRPRSWNPNITPAVALTPAQNDLVNFEPSFSPDGNTIAYVRREDQTGTHMSIYTMPVAENVANDPNVANFNPNNPTNAANALVPYNTQSKKLLTDRYVSQPVWSPDGTKLLYYGFSNNTFDLYLVVLTKDTNTGLYSVKPDSQVQLTQTNGLLNADSRAVWTP